MTKTSMTPPPASDNPWIGGLIRAAKRGDIQASITCLHVLGRALQNQEAPDPALAQYVGGCLVEAAHAAVTMRRQKTEKRATEVAKVLGLIARRPGPRAPYFKLTHKQLNLACLVVHFRQLGCPLTRKEGGTFYRAANVLGCKPGTAKAAFQEFRKHEALQDPTFQETMIFWAKVLIKGSRKRG